MNWVSKQVTDLDPLPRVKRFLKGYDVMYGNPRGSGLADPGFKLPIFEATYEEKKTTEYNDRDYKQPDKISTSSCLKSRNYHFKERESEGSKSYQDSQEHKASIQGGGWG